MTYQKERKSMNRYILLTITVILMSVFLISCGNQTEVTSSQFIENTSSMDEMAKYLDNLYDRGQDSVVLLLGEPDAKTALTQEENDIWSRVVWTYTEECLTIEFVDRGSGFVVSRATATQGCPIGTSKDVYVGATESQIRTVYSDSINEEYSLPEMRTIVVGQPSNCIVFHLDGEIVSSIVVGEMG